MRNWFLSALNRLI